MLVSGGNKILLVGFILSHFHSSKWERPLPDPEHSGKGCTPCAEGHACRTSAPVPVSQDRGPEFGAQQPCGCQGTGLVNMEMGAEDTAQPPALSSFLGYIITPSTSTTAPGPQLQPPTPTSDHSLLQIVTVEALLLFSGS